MNRLAVLWMVAIVAWTAHASAHEVRPAYLQLRQMGAETYDVLWKVPGRGDDLRLGLYVQFPEGCVNLSEPRGVFAAAAYSERWCVKRSGGLDGARIHIAGLSASMTDVLVRVEKLDGTTQVARLSPAEPSFLVSASPGKARVAETYLRLGIEHILGGIDHLLFVLALLLLVSGWRRVVATVTAFTAAHSLTLAAATLGFVHVPQKPIEAVIGLSIVFVAAEIVQVRRGRPGLTQRRPWMVAFVFGLLHGFGFAGALSEAGLPEQAIPIALLFFNIGVELGQLLFIGIVFAAVSAARQLARRVVIHQPVWAWRVPPYAIGSVASFWIIQRIAAF